MKPVANSHGSVAQEVPSAPPGGWIEYPAPRVAPAKGRELGVFGRPFVALVRIVTRGRVVNVFASIGHNRGILRPWLMFAARLMPFGKLERADTELVILRVAWNCRSRYEWVQHVPIGLRSGLSKSDIDRIKLGADAEGWAPRQRTIINAVDELHDRNVITDTTWKQLAAMFDPPRLIELCMLVGNYQMLAGTMNSFGTPIESVHKSS
ncbi:MAG: carboxymuconolactone decarboxylase family protein [Thermoleophilaceae bacterium]|nr:carboxymuconolactone decarboxylase family protein [Thermoleophilaceae bacterium]